MPNAALASAAAGTSDIGDAVTTLKIAPGDSPPLADEEAMRAKLKRRILAPRR